MPSASSRAAALLTVAATLAVVGLLLAITPIRDAFGLALHGDLDGLRDTLREEGALAAAVLVGLVLLHAVVPFPAELPTAAAGFALGFAVGFPLMLVAWLLSALATYAIASHAGRPVIARLASEERLARAEALVARAGVGGLLAVRLIPLVPFSLVCATCGVARVPLRRYAWTTVVGMVPLTALVTLLGVRLQSPNLDDPLLWAILAGLLALTALSRPLARRLRTRREGGT